MGLGSSQTPGSWRRGSSRASAIAAKDTRPAGATSPTWPPRRHSAPWVPTASRPTGKSRSMVARGRPLTRARAPPRASATRRRRAGRSGGTITSSGRGAKSSRVPSISRNRVQASGQSVRSVMMGGGALIGASPVATPDRKVVPPRRSAPGCAPAYAGALPSATCAPPRNRRCIR